MSYKKLLFITLIIVLVGSVFAFDLTQYLTLEQLKQQQQALNQLFAERPLFLFGLYFLIYVISAALSIPGATVLTIGAGAIFGLGWGLLLASFASSVGALLAFLSARWLLHDWVQKKFGNRLKAINAGIERDGAFYLLSLRLVPLFPFFVINLVMGLTKIKAWTYYWVSQVGMLLATAVYVNAGTQLAEITSLGDVLSFDLLSALVLLGLVPILAKFILSFLKRRRAYGSYTKPKSFDNNLVVIGAGSAGLVSAYIAAAVKAKVTLIEKHKMGGDCLNTGCVPSKALLHVAKSIRQTRDAERLGVKSTIETIDFAKIMDSVQDVIARIAPHDSVERYTELGVDVECGDATIVSPWEVQVQNGEEQKTITTRSIVIATGARPMVPDFPGLSEVDYLTSDNLWQLRELPRRLLVLGGGPIGCELAQAFQLLGSQVTVVEMGPRLLSNDDTDAAALVQKQLRDDGLELRLNHKAIEFTERDGERVLLAEHEDETVALPFDRVLIALGRQANLEGFGLQELGIEAGKTLKLNELLQTNFPNIYACGDVAGPYQFTHVASHQAWYAAVNALFDPYKNFRVDYSVIPWVTYTTPEVANVGLTEQTAAERGVDYEVTEYDISDLDRAIADQQAYGRIKVLTVPGKDKILGVNIVSAQAGELLAEYVLAMKQGIGLNKILGTIHSYPTMAEANKYVAGNWKRANAPEKLLGWVQKFHRWRRG
ncbi:FAD-dependent oxidoreductase [Pseudidiomarina terrestris]|uniref:FAD-dependent oxidoreductase n=1 Tax=Pseudidiomarina terrestris TaxID=2820060 RepID=A0AAW7R234_9GAMM|nr:MULTISPECIES: bifunctional TVP38/TMEM64 family protein/FAD-dependent oxidoreductase [unclassified Pseudidiomarina]MDN7125334.1 FAD-dependent oxidoreductase [Pseudidiomarina sp. 1APP75-32.1]MDN7127937.1 FAD-dependent oxidoreductase [Pseudidiomarina sp. 1APR75-33.1]MDN7130093.1 FAD-dependent oxidoreductase [Pseudidiomarina sp. 1APR75-15]MDN7135597.1 FAD-dependent oxidoreductase [Pseudidiomarina sp. 1ASP75-5]MEA3589107.1 FAD-dependent oxidoreductase [Pseudidiomarina sp. 1APP75-27a]